jgi:predicted nuclease of restriction endonuclease-like (RecB) superfamily
VPFEAVRMTSHTPLTSPDYTTWLHTLKARIQSARISAARAANRELILLYWDMGCGIVEKQQGLGWGKSVVEQLSADLQAEFPGLRGFSANNLWLMRQFYTEYSAPEFLVAGFPDAGLLEAPDLEQPVQDLPGVDLGVPGSGLAVQPNLEQLVQDLLAPVPWGHHVEVLKKVKAAPERLYYLRATAQFGWTRAVLLNQIKAQAYARSLADGKSHNFPLALPEHLAEQAEETLKSSYNLEFLGIGRAVKERELEDALINKLRDFILELGYGFCFIGRQHRLVLGQKEYFIDLLFYHRFLKCLVAIELKIGEFEPEFAGKMDFYLNLLNDRERAPDDNPSIGIILCAEKDDLEVEFALKSKANPIGVAEYQLKTTLPKELQGKLPSAEELGQAIGLPAKATPKRRSDP